jgi:hypothetical protein
MRAPWSATSDVALSLAQPINHQQRVERREDKAHHAEQLLVGR